MHETDTKQYFTSIHQQLSVGQIPDAEAVSWQLRLRRALLNFGTQLIALHDEEAARFAATSADRIEEHLRILVDTVLQEPGASDPKEWLRYVQDRKLSGVDMVCACPCLCMCICILLAHTGTGVLVRENRNGDSAILQRLVD